MVKTGPVLIRINTRVFPEQHKFIKNLAKKMKCGEGELHREIIANYITRHNKKNKWNQKIKKL